MINFLFFGDSITLGEHDHENGGFVDSLRKYTYEEFIKHQKNEIKCYNLGIGGETTNGAIQRLKIEIEARLGVKKTIIFLAYGTNDLAEKDGLKIVSSDQFRSNYEKLIKICKDYTREIYILNILPISHKINGTNRSNRKTRFLKDIKAYNSIILDLTKQHQVNYIDNYSKFEFLKEELLSVDGLHPNPCGYKLLTEQIRPILSKFL